MTNSINGKPANNLFVSCDWGTSHFRLRLANRDDGRIMNEFCSNDGISQLANSSNGVDRSAIFRTTLTRWVDDLAVTANLDLHGIPILISGMAGSSIGWHEVPYARLPFSLDGRDAIWEDIGPMVSEGRVHRVFLLSGVQNGMDVMRGEETESMGVAALLADQRTLDKIVFVLPGTHAKHIHIFKGRIVDFQTYMTGELFDVLHRHSVLCFSTQPLQGRQDSIDWYTTEMRQAFREGVSLTRSDALPSLLFKVRSRHLLGGCPPNSNMAFLSGILIGTELSCLASQYEDDMPIFLCAGAQMNCLYTMAFDVLGLSERLTIVSPSDVERLPVLGQSLMLKRIQSVHEVSRSASDNCNGKEPIPLRKI